jgi:hypothetical protein
MNRSFNNTQYESDTGSESESDTGSETGTDTESESESDNEEDLDELYDLIIRGKVKLNNDYNNCVDKLILMSINNNDLNLFSYILNNFSINLKSIKDYINTYYKSHKSFLNEINKKEHESLSIKNWKKQIEGLNTKQRRRSS